MAAAVHETTSVKIGAGGVQFTMTASRVKFDGFMSVYMEADDKEEKNQLLAKLEKGQELELVSLEDAQHFTQSAGPLYGGLPGKGSGGAGHRTSQYLCSHHHHDPVETVHHERK